MNYGLNQAAQTSQLPPPNKRAAVHETSSQVWNRLAAANDALSKLLARVRGAQPAGTESGKNPELSILALLADTNIELNTLEAQINELSQVIG